MLWANDWEYGTVTIIICVFFHTISLLALTTIMFHEKLAGIRNKSIYISAILFSFFALCTIVIHVIDALMWAIVYLRIGAANDFPSAFLHSLGAFTTLGDATIIVDEKWRLLIQLEALNGAVALGLTTALLYSSARRIQQIIDAGVAREHRK
jgi:hypothetical protein